jgi:hypothetical protein
VVTGQLAESCFVQGLQESSYFEVLQIFGKLVECYC